MASVYGFSDLFHLAQYNYVSNLQDCILDLVLINTSYSVLLIVEEVEVSAMHLLQNLLLLLYFNFIVQCIVIYLHSFSMKQVLVLTHCYSFLKNSTVRKVNCPVLLWYK